MIRISLILLSILLVGTTQAQQRRVDGIIRSLRDPASKQVLVVAHRGDWRNAPENSLLAIEYAIEKGVDVVEIDLKKSKDGVLILMHDQTIDRTTSGKGKPEDYTWAELQQLTLKNPHGAPTRQRIPTFEQCMLAAKGRVMINVDKGYDYFQEAYAVLEKIGTVDHAIIKSSEPYEKVKAENGNLLSNKQLAYMPIVDLGKPNAATMLRDYEQKLNPVAVEVVSPPTVRCCAPTTNLFRKTTAGSGTIACGRALTPATTMSAAWKNASPKRGGAGSWRTEPLLSRPTAPPS
nr:glycerophosphodiester phosphodiesterase family protein [Hymenobacter crusticola]